MDKFGYGWGMGTLQKVKIETKNNQTHGERGDMENIPTLNYYGHHRIV